MTEIMVHISRSPHISHNIYQTVSAPWVIILSRLAIKKKLLMDYIKHYMGLVLLLADLVQIGISMVCCTNFTSWLQGTAVGSAL